PGAVAAGSPGPRTGATAAGARGGASPLGNGGNAGKVSSSACVGPDPSGVTAAAAGEGEGEAAVAAAASTARRDGSVPAASRPGARCGGRGVGAGRWGRPA